ncbi:MAG: class I SAM-dependent methyltransferase [Acidimicrobiales bacterium]
MPESGSELRRSGKRSGAASSAPELTTAQNLAGGQTGAMVEEDRAGDAPSGPHVAWRLATARRLAPAYRALPTVAALTVTGSVGAGLADRFSDLELDCYWTRPPSKQDRGRPAKVAGGASLVVWPYDPDEKEWSEDFELDGLSITVSGFLVADVETLVDALTSATEADPDPMKQVRAASIGHSVVLLGAGLIEGWRARLETYPDALVAAAAARALDADQLPGWASRQALVERGDLLAVHDLLVRAQRAVLQAVSALNRAYLGHPLAKWQRSTVAAFRLAPPALGDRLERMWSLPPSEALGEAETLLVETATLAGRHGAVEVDELIDAVRRRRPALWPPSVGAAGADAGTHDHRYRPRSVPGRGDLRETARSYDAVAERYAEEIGGELAAKPLDRALLGALVETCAGGVVADIGCGPGHVAAHLADRHLADRHLAGHRLAVLGVDLSVAMCSIARRAGVPAASADMEALPIRSDSLAGLVCWYALIHLDAEGRAGAYREIYRVLRPGGYALVAFHTSDPETPPGGVKALSEWSGQDVHLLFRFLDPGQETAALRGAGLHLIARTDREPGAGEHPSRRSYLLMQRRSEAVADLGEAADLLDC